MDSESRHPSDGDSDSETRTTVLARRGIKNSNKNAYHQLATCGLPRFSLHSSGTRVWPAHMRPELLAQADRAGGARGGFVACLAGRCTPRQRGAHSAGRNRNAARSAAICRQSGSARCSKRAPARCSR